MSPRRGTEGVLWPPSCCWTRDPPRLPAILGDPPQSLSVYPGLRFPLLSHPDDLASKANIVIDPLELQAATMDDLDEDEEPAPAAAQVPPKDRLEVSWGLSSQKGMGVRATPYHHAQVVSPPWGGVVGRSSPCPLPTPQSRGTLWGPSSWGAEQLWPPSLYCSAPCRPWPWGAPCPCLGLVGSVRPRWAEPTASSARQP